ncbi:MAG: ABC transporter permease [Bacteroidales bacterium]|nr:ABC transporter permease [Bacteroidales bacterium]
MLFYKRKKYIKSASLNRLAWQRLMKDKVAVFSMIFICIIFLISILGYLITPDNTPFANEQHLELCTKKPGFSVKVLKIKKNEKPVNTPLFKYLLFGKKNDYNFIPINDYYFEGNEIVINKYSEQNDTIIKKYSLADVIFPISKIDNSIIIENNNLIFKDINNKLIKCSVKELRHRIERENIKKKRYVLGTDRFGRDVLSQLMIGARVSLSVGFISVIISLIIGILLGALAGFFKGWVDNLIMWVINVVWSIPTLLLVIAITFALGKGFWQVFIAVGLTMWVEVARIVRGQVLSIREKEYIEAGRALGFKNFRIIFRHILPNVLGAVIVVSAANFASAILLEAGLSFLGIGVQPPMPSWGSMIKENYGFIILDYAYLAILPGICIMLLVLAFMLLGNSLRDALDVKTVNVKN